ncbi:RagB/SusD family nutrient uptake outer membrane protein [Belliella kenyensis]|uniref:RagB/SusD family nutrient uptake outer membrane protein n=1 Tax=Belliella kenyensis TaxID=1472724 RepID=A0ABV8EGA6_9BACT|nr:RagB/SusD family nutrient uptake outer membrane protein [Belliella kenyensis]MCH7401116.1 RagB/SusD family nutrient uptake outer membrane protein [Belliella kenyensis]MDN3604113.1 RagB/SusD family nutrient uptake outer membrane protein [Belliella kenyensis]
MKKYKKSIVVILSLLTMSCGDYFDKEPIGLITQEQISSDPTEQSIVSAVNSTYQMYSQTLNVIGEWDWTGGKVLRNDFIIYDIASGDMLKKWNPDGDQAWMDEVGSFNFTSINGAFNGAWSYSFEAISRANTAISILEQDHITSNTGMSQNLIDRLLAESLFLRALSYFELVNNFGDVPMITVPLDSFADAYEVSVRRPASEVWQLIMSDLQKASSLLPQAKFSSQSEPWRVSKGAVLSLIAKAELYQENYQNVISIISQIEDLGFYSLNVHYFDSFDVTKHFQENEVIFAYDHQEGRNPRKGNGLAALMGWGFVAPSESFVQAFEQGDPRLFYTVDLTNRNVNKLLGTKNGLYKGNDDSPGNKIYIRYADVLLWKAEALIKLGNIEQGLLIVDMVRLRAKNTPYVNGTLPDPSILAPYAGRGLNQAEALQALIQERRVELGFESHRFNDLKRWGIALDILRDMGKNFQAHHMLFPIPQEEVDRSGGLINQNQGY